MAVAAPSQPYVVQYADMRHLDFPVSGAGANIPIGTIMIPGATAGTNVGVAIPAAANSGSNTYLGLLLEPHVFSGTNSSGDATTQTLVQWFFTGAVAGQVGGSILGVPSSTNINLPSHKLDLLDTLVAVKLDYAISDATSITVTSMTGSTTINNGTARASMDSTFIYFSAGTAIGQLAFIKSSVNTTSMAIISALTTTPVAGDTMVTINPLFYNTPVILINSATVPGKIDTSLAAGSTAFLTNLANFISQNGLIARLDPKIHHNIQKQNALTQLGFFSYTAFGQTILHP